MIDEQKSRPGPDEGLDNLFRRTLDGYQMEPSPGTWRGVSRKLLWSEMARFNFRNIPKAIWIGGTALLLVGLIILI